MGKYRVFVHVLAVGKIRSENKIDGIGKNPSGGIAGAPITKTRISESVTLHFSTSSLAGEVTSIAPQESV